MNKALVIGVALFIAFILALGTTLAIQRYEAEQAAQAQAFYMACACANGESRGVYAPSVAELDCADTCVGRGGVTYQAQIDLNATPLPPTPTPAYQTPTPTREAFRLDDCIQVAESVACIRRQ